MTPSPDPIESLTMVPEVDAKEPSSSQRFVSLLHANSGAELVNKRGKELNELVVYDEIL